MPQQKSHTRILIPQRTIQGGFDFKFESDPYDVKLYGIMTPEQYTSAIDALNLRIRKARAGKLDGMLLASGALIVPLMLWGVRHRNQVKKRKRQLKKGIAEFNEVHPTLYMRWNRKPDSKLTIEQRSSEEEGGMAQAQLLGDVVVQAMPPTNNNNSDPASSGLV
jgi:hypothetical protein